MSKKHLMIIDTQLVGREYGTLASFQQSIIDYTKADIYFLPFLSKLEKRLHQTSRFSFLRKIFLKKKRIVLHNNYDVLWYICMGPENYRFDVLEGFENIPNRIIYLFDTLPHQLKLIKKIARRNDFNYQITSFNDAQPILEKLTNSKWYFIQQASSKRYFKEYLLKDKEVAFTSFGRGNSRLNEIIQQFCDENNLIFERTHESSGKVITNNVLLYKHYCRILSKSVFNICYPVEITNPNRAGELSPITCRWYESILARNIVLGERPKNPNFGKIFPKEFVHMLDLNCTNLEIKNQLNYYWQNKDDLFDALYNQQMEDSYDWVNRVEEINNLITY